jgi:topoisomerase IA-like protein
MENIKPYLGKIEDSPVFLNNGKYGWYLNYNDTLYSIPKCFQSKDFDLKTAQKIITWKNAHPTPSSKIPNIAQLDAFEKAKKAKKQSDDESEEDKNLSMYSKLKKKGII